MSLTVYNRDIKLAKLHFIYKVLFVLILTPFLFAAMTQVFENFFWAYAATSVLSIYLFCLSLFMN